jgi:hypothetical protein
MTVGDTIRQIQGLLGVEPDGDFGALSEGALQRLLASAGDSTWLPMQAPAIDGSHQVLATSFADPEDVAAFQRCKAEGNSDEYCFALGDNGIGCWGDDITGSQPACALPPEVWLAKWGSKEAAHNKTVVVSANTRSVTCLLQDTMPHQADIKNGAGIDLNPAAVAALGFSPPLKTQVTWRWVLGQTGGPGRPGGGARS